MSVLDYDQLLKRRDAAAARLGRLQGRRDAAMASLKQVEDECVSLNVAPADLAGVILKLQAKVAEEGEALADSLNLLEDQLKGFEAL